MGDSDEYDELDVRYEDQYWNTEVGDYGVASNYIGEPLRFGTEDHVDMYGVPKEEPTAVEDNSAALTQLQRRGFHLDHCERALHESNNEFGTALEYLLMECVQDSSDFFVRKFDSMVTMRHDRYGEVEIMKMMYGDYFKIIIEEKLYAFQLYLPELTKYLHENTEYALDYMKTCTSNSTITIDELFETDDFEICKFFTKEKGCRYGDKCKKLHLSLEEQLKEKSEKKTKQEMIDSMCLYKIEIRITRHYPYRAGLVSFQSSNKNMTQGQILAMTECLLKQSFKMAEIIQPCVFHLITFLTEFDNYKDVLKECHPLSMPFKE